jgi:NAD(P)-dependent dehydrogenase (short-subunit alcohol dehydrogenase family)
MFKDAPIPFQNARRPTLMPVALITGASRGLGLALALDLGAAGWSLVLDARGAPDLLAAVAALDPARTRVVPGDVTHPGHRADLVSAALDLGGLDLLVNNASHLGPSPQPRLADYPAAELARVYDVDVLAPHALLEEALPLLRRSVGTVVNVSSDAAVEAYEGWGGYGSAKAALDHLTVVLAAEETSLRVYAFDPGDMRTAMHQAAFPGEDISDRPEPGTVAVPAVRTLLARRPPSGRYRAADLLMPVGAAR